MYFLNYIFISYKKNIFYKAPYKVSNG